MEAVKTTGDLHTGIIIYSSSPSSDRHLALNIIRHVQLEHCAANHQTDASHRPFTMENQIHPIYRLYFLWVDPILTLMGMYVNLIDHDLATLAFFSTVSPTETLKPFLYQIGGMGTSFLCLFVILLRYTNDVNVWKIVQFAILWADFTMLTSMCVAMRHEGRLAVSDWRQEDWVSIVITVICTILRAVFVMGVGVKQTGVKCKKA
ncbi:hypothetical protein B0T10DRAFT_490725 [Thelonectria olida]|uniref:DUF7704 domain-containing protein n=1 Tax=Thelonectria olida TaxID=1576542 RepID=A0A9P9AKG2_9HYPO|nr:hypothetical protein B0T10DRAFT_490725 [Thelonectria olida]